MVSKVPEQYAALPKTRLTDAEEGAWLLSNAQGIANLVAESGVKSPKKVIVHLLNLIAGGVLTNLGAVRWGAQGQCAGEMRNVQAMET